MRPTPGVEWRRRPITASTLWQGNCPPSPGLAPCAILICIMSELTRYSVVTPKRPEATCLIAERIESPFGSGLKRSASSPPSPVLDLPPIRFIAIASVVCASREIERSEERRVGKEGRSRWSPYHLKKKKYDRGLLRFIGRCGHNGRFHHCEEGIHIYAEREYLCMSVV